MKKAEKSRLLKAEERDTILAALRYYQRCFTGPDSRKVFQALRFMHGIEEIATNSGAHPPLSASAIDGLCETINCSVISIGD